VLAAFSTTPGMLIGARALLGVDGATLAPSTLSLIRNMFPDPRQWALAVGVWMLPSSVGLILGSMLAPVLVRRARPWQVMTTGLVLGAFGFGLLTRSATPPALAWS
jgi:MFS family permease